MKNRQWWPLKRRKQFLELRKLIHEIETINHGSDALGRIQRCIILAQRLEGKLGDSFIHFLGDEMFAGERPASELRAEARKKKV